MNPDSFQNFAETLDRVAATSSKLEKTRILADYFRQLSREALPSACRFILGVESARGEVGVGWSTMMASLEELRGVDRELFRKLYLESGDAGTSVEKVLGKTPPPTLLDSTPLTILGVQRAFDSMAGAKGSGSTGLRKKLLMGLYGRAGGREAKYLTKILGSELRIGATEGIVLDALKQAFGNDEVREWYLVTGDIGELAEKLSRADTTPPSPRLFRPVAFMLAQPLSTPEEIWDHFSKQVIAEYKYDGIRVQAHIGGRGEVRLFSRRMEDITRSLPDITSSILNIGGGTILDGEVLGFRRGKPMSFMKLQTRLHRKEVGEELARQVPVHYFVFDLLLKDGRNTLDLPLAERRRILSSLKFEGNVHMSAGYTVGSAAQIEKLFKKSRDAGYEGLVLKDPLSTYTPGRRGGAWVKLKEELSTIDAVVVAAEYGNGKRAGQLSDLTFAVWDAGQLKTIGKAYSGLTNQEIAQMTEKLRSMKTADTWNGVIVPPQIVIEVAFDSIQRSNRHNSGYALRFPRIKRVRDDKKPEDADSLEEVERLYNQQVVLRH